ncbi:phytanoyl-CoA dioxygenase [Aquimarina sp. RZ0]|uniref:phytanoyl-CoA dioxygenase n=1 Tax=Aquimarina sp. RZ0 TaxID=2607730 RepID=UPI0011F2A4D4|nr:phytanoyl-CoA dioxygenase [Aquimarina sp. RZ0]KAA1245075.1 phytanoyl-CoA dioxygenase [Aquimarina sp. RZ0]
MNPTQTFLKVKFLSQQLINKEISNEEVVQIINEIHECFQEITNISGYDTEFNHLVAVPTATGMALSLNHAAQCLLDYKRTMLFLKGMIAAINDAKKEYPNQRIHIFYAGCGPYAPFVTLVAPLFHPDEIQFSVLEINKDSLALATKLIDSLSLSAYVKEFYLADAVTFKIPDAHSIHVLFSETLDALLYRESYVPILWNMLPQLPQQVKVIPNNVTLDASVSNTNPEKKSVKDEVSCIFDVRQTFLYHTKVSELPQHFSSKKIKLKTNYKIIIIDTQVHIYKNLWLKRGESSLTIPYQIDLETHLKHTHTAIKFTYELKPQVGLKHEFLKEIPI